MADHDVIVDWSRDGNLTPVVVAECACGWRRSYASTAAANYGAQRHRRRWGVGVDVGPAS